MYNSSEEFTNKNKKVNEPIIDAKTNEIDSNSHMDGDLTPKHLKHIISSGGF